MNLRRLPLLFFAAFALPHAPPAHAAAAPAPDPLEPLLRALPEAVAKPGGVYALIEARAVAEAFGREFEYSAAAAALPDAGLDPDSAYYAALERSSMAVLALDRAKAAATLAPFGIMGEARFIGAFGTGEDREFDETQAPEEGLDGERTYPGKDDRPARWRTIALPPGDLVFNTGRYLYPAERGIAFYAAQFTLTAPATVRFRLGASDRVALKVDGAEWFRWGDPHAFAAGQFRFEAPLPAGTHRVLVKHWFTNAQARLALSATADGAPVRFSAAADGPWGGAARPAVRETEWPRAGRRPREYARGLRLWRTRAFPPAGHADLDALASASADRPGDEMLRLVLAWAQPQNEHEIEILRDCVDTLPAAPLCALRLARLEWRRGRPLDALRLLEALPGPWRESTDALVLRHAMRGESDLAGDSAGRVEALAQAHPARYDLWPVAAELYRAAGLESRAERIEEAQHARLPGNNSSVWAIVERNLLRGGGEAALEPVLRILAGDPLEVGLRENLAHYWLRQDEPARALEWFDAQLAVSPDDPEGLRGRAEALARLGRDTEANEALRRAVAARPQDEDLRRYLAWREQRGEGFEKPYRAEIRPLLAAADGAGRGAEGGAGAVFLLDQSVVRVAASGLSSRYRQMVVRIEDASGAKAWESWATFFDGTSDDFVFLAAQRWRAGSEGGFSPSEGERGVYPVPDGIDNMYYRSRGAHVRFADLRPGDVINLEYRIDDLNASNAFGSYFGDLILIGGNFPVKRQRYTLLTPPGKVLHHEVHGLEDTLKQRRLESVPGLEGPADERVWEFSPPAPPPPEPDGPPAIESRPFLHLSTFKTWEEMGRWYAGFIRDRFTLESAQEKEMRAEFADAGDEDDAALRLAHRRATHRVHYIGLEFGVRGFLPFSAGQTLRQGFGDCKDKATLFATLASLLGEPAEIVLVRTRDAGRLKTTLPSLALFNHAIAYLPRREMFVDGTADFVGLGALPEMDQGGDALIIRRDGSVRKTTLPVPAPEQNLEQRDYVISATGADADRSRIEARLRFAGNPAPGLRARYDKAETRREQLEHAVSGTFTGFRLSDAEFSDLSDYEAPVSIRYAGDAERILRREGRTLWLRARPGLDPLAPDYATLSRRTLPLDLGAPRTVRMSVRYRLPEGARVRRLPPAAEQRGPSGRWMVRWSRQGADVLVESELQFTSRWVEPAQYAALRGWLAAADSAFSADAEVELESK